ncbi:MAG: M20 family metallopeptidase [Candidatus Brocadiales bacterium]|nr:M20 family metallopeptidase [Candidatus Brocadiales bacterium]
MQREINQFFEDQREELVRLASELIAARTENPPGNETLAVRVVERYLKDLEIRYHIFEKEPGRSNIVARIGTGKPSLLVACHLDVVPAGDGWQQDPFQAMILDGRIYGRGASDNKGQMAASMVLARFLKEREASLKGEFILVGAADEERGSRLGLEYLLKECELKADFAIIPDVSYGMEKIDICEKGALFLRITSYGRQAHGSRPEQGVNAIWNMIDLLLELGDMPFKVTSHPLFTPPTLNLGTIQGGAARNIVPGKCQVGIDIRYLPGETKEDILERVQALIKKVESASGGQARFELQVESHLNPSQVPLDNPLVELIGRHTEAVLGQRPEIMGLSGATVTKQLLEKGITAVGFGPGDEDQAHIANESIEVQQLVDFAKVMALLSLELLGGDKE